MINRRGFTLLCLAFASAASELHAGYVLKDGKLIDVKDLATDSLESHYNRGIIALKEKQWDEAKTQFRVVTISFPNAELAKTAYFFLGVAYYYSGDKDLANRNFSTYLKEQNNPKYFEEAFRYKLAIADAFKNGERRHLFGYEKLPQWQTGRQLSITIYDEIIASLGNSELAARALISKAELLHTRREFRQASETLQTLIRKFPRTEYAAHAYVSIAEVYLDQASCEIQNPDILALAQINLKRFTESFPRDAHIDYVKSCIRQMQEIFANALYETGQFYERKGEPKAACLYYHTSMTQFPETEAALSSKSRLNDLEEHANEIALP